MHIRFKFKPQDCWIGVFWRKTYLLPVKHRRRAVIDIYICVLPMLPLHIAFIKWMDPAKAKEVQACE